MNPSNPPNPFLNPIADLNVAALDGAKSGAAASIGRMVTIKALSLLKLDHLLGDNRIVADLVALATCYGLALTFSLVNIPQAERVRTILALAAKGLASSIVQAVLPQLRDMSAWVIGLAATHQIDEKVKEAGESAP